MQKQSKVVLFSVSIVKLTCRILFYSLQLYEFSLCIAEVLKLWPPPPEEALFFSLGGKGAICLYEGHIYFERNMGAT
jgi:hypothetical protein